jgi:S-disulfanyl-L-cysteine oxidoreductase SoxD
MKFAAYVVVPVLGLALLFALEQRLMAQNKPSRSVWEAVYSDTQAGRGRTLYQQQCAGCHGARLDGTEVSPALAGAEFLANWGGLTVGDLFERIRTTMPLNNARSLTREAAADIVAYMLNINQFPGGSAELPADPQALQLIRIDVQKPN